MNISNRNFQAQESTPLSELKPSSQMPVPAAYYYEKDDEISLVDLWLILAKHKWLIFASIVLCLIAAIAASFLLTEKTTYITTIKIGGGTTPIESNEDVIAKLQENYIPMISNQREVGIKVDTRTPKGSSLVLLESTVTIDKQNDVKTLHSDIGKLLINDHAAELGLKKTGLKNQIELLNNNLADLQSSPYLSSLQNQTTELRKQILDTSDQTELLENLKNELRFLQTELAKEEQNLLLKKVETQTSIARLQEQIDNLPETKLLTTALDTEKSGTSPLLVIVLGAVLGLMLGVFVAFFAEFFSKVKAVQAEQALAKTER